MSSRLWAENQNIRFHSPHFYGLRVDLNFSGESLMDTFISMKDMAVYFDGILKKYGGNPLSWISGPHGQALHRNHAADHVADIITLKKFEFRSSQAY